VIIMSKPKIAVMGAGHGGFGLSGYLSLNGFEVNLFEFPEYKASIKPLYEPKGIYIHGVMGEGVGKLNKITTDAREALKGVDIIFISIPAWGHKTAAIVCASTGIITTEQKIVLLPGNTGGALEFRQVFMANGGNPEVVIAESPSFIFACKKDSIRGGRPDGVNIQGIKDGMQIGVMPAEKTSETVEFLKQTFKEFTPAEDVLEVGVSNANHWMHPPSFLLNVARIESMGGGFPYCGKRWGHGATKSVCRLMEALDKDRLKLVKTLGYKPISALEHWKKMYGHYGGMEADNIYDFISKTPVYSGSRMPGTLEDRHFTEPVPYGLVPMASIGKELKLDLPIMNSFINVYCATFGRDYRAEGRNAESMGLKGLSKGEMRQFVRSGSF
jgi:opine dehydrogenase